MDVVTVRKDRAMHLERHGVIEVDHPRASAIPKEGRAAKIKAQRR